MASFGSWLNTNWFNLVQTVSIVVGLIFAGLSFRKETRSKRLANLLSLKTEHRELWNVVHENPAYGRIMKTDSEVDLLGQPMTPQEEIFLRQMIVHFAVSFELVNEGTPFDFEGFRRDAGQIFSLPLPRLAWEKVKAAQSRRFVNFINDTVKAEPRRKRSAR